ncbi:hypothetical protein [Inconstantimicrobium mannanitabidum]|uniref:Uncharacterized protein n=1 Tax=Inconstantimicrobium mannanitabidum TaxID=1604901 RepID=A0ACB5RCF9_9CLOT|nr:hypothetical protein [Clostridium sp. TW13]GKX66564.1 hypothetical protein rsdtw13_18220 [Clostridium sp. TW13]
MNIILSLMVGLGLAFNNILIKTTNTEVTTPASIDAIILAYDTMHTADKDQLRDYIILDMESIYFTDTTYEERKKVIEYFEKYNKPVLNASLFKLQRIGLANKRSELKINGELLMFTDIYPDDSSGMVFEGWKYYAPLGAKKYRIKLKVVNNKWSVIDVEFIGVA